MLGPRSCLQPRRAETGQKHCCGQQLSAPSVVPAAPRTKLQPELDMVGSTGAACDSGWQGGHRSEALSLRVQGQAGTAGLPPGVLELPLSICSSPLHQYVCKRLATPSGVLQPQPDLKDPGNLPQVFTEFHYFEFFENFENFQCRYMHSKTLIKNEIIPPLR